MGAHARSSLVCKFEDCREEDLLVQNIYWRVIDVAEKETTSVTS